MATLNEVMKDTADAIREKTGKSELIAPVDFAEEIKGITAGGGDTSEDKWRYFDISAIDTSNQDAKDFVQNSLLGLWSICLMKESGVYFPCTSATAYTYVAEENYKVYRVGFDGAQKMMNFKTGEVVSCEEIYNTMIAAQLANWGGVEITKEQFYNIE
jgi:hypothetical protein